MDQIAVENETEHVSGKCPMDTVLRLIMGPWTTYILWLLGTEGPLRFGVLKSKIDGISAKVLTERLRMLENAGLVYRDYKPTVPPQVSYSLTERGFELREALQSLHQLAVRWNQQGAVENLKKTG